MNLEKKECRPSSSCIPKVLISCHAVTDVAKLCTDHIVIQKLKTRNMNTIFLKRIFHRGKECVGLNFYNNPTLNNLVQKLTGVKWSQTNKCWFIPREPGWYNELKVLTKGKVTLTGSGLEDDKESASISNIVVSRSINKSISKVSTPLVEQQLSNVNQIALQQFIRQLQLKAYSASTIRTYRTEFLQLLKLLKTNL